VRTVYVFGANYRASTMSHDILRHRTMSSDVVRSVNAALVFSRQRSYRCKTARCLRNRRAVSVVLRNSNYYLSVRL